MFKAKSIADQGIIYNLKKLSLQDDIELNDLLREAIQLVFLKHHLDLGGNPQLTLVNFHQAPLIRLGKCDINGCHSNAIHVGLNLKTKKEQKFCDKCFRNVHNRYDPKFWKWNKEEPKE
jgi:hypothetical protein